MSNRRARDKDKTVQDILAAAKHLFSERGLHGVSIRDIENASGVSKGLILHHFGTKEKLYAAVQDLLTQEYIAMMAAQGKRSENLQEMVSAVIRKSFLFTKRNRHYRRMSLWSYLEGQERNTELGQQFTLALAEAMRSGQQSGLIREDIDAFMMPFIIKGAIDYWILKEKLIQKLTTNGENKKTGSDKRFIDALVKLFLK
jgi:TetR/AcrR family transcriptional regulator